MIHETIRNAQMSLARFVFRGSFRVASHSRRRSIEQAVVALPALLFIVFVPIVSFAHPASGIVVDRNGQVYFSDLETIWKIGTDGQLSVIRSGVRGRHVHELSIDDQDNIYGADLSYDPTYQRWINALWRMTVEGQLTWLVEPTDSRATRVSIWRDREGNTYYVDQNNNLKRETLIIKRTPAGKATTFAGGAYGNRDGKGTEARFGSIGGTAFGPDGCLYLSDGESLRKVSMDGTVITVANNLNFKTAEDDSPLFAGDYGTLMGLSVDPKGNVYIADAGNRRLLKIDGTGKVTVALRSQSPYYPTGAFATATGDVYVLEVGNTLPASWSGPRVRKLSKDGSNRIIATVGADLHGANKAGVAQTLGASAEAAIGFFYIKRKTALVIGVFGLLGVVGVAVVWRRLRKQGQI